MAYKVKSGQGFDRSASLVKVQTMALSGASGTYTAAAITSYGLTRIASTGSGAGWAVKLNAPRKGLEKRIVVTQRSTAPVIIYTHSTACTIGGTTNNNITFTTGGAGAERSVHLIGLSTAAWMLAGKSTGASLAASTSPF